MDNAQMTIPQKQDVSEHFATENVQQTLDIANLLDNLPRIRQPDPIANPQKDRFYITISPGAKSQARSRLCPVKSDHVR